MYVSIPFAVLPSNEIPPPPPPPPPSPPTLEIVIVSVAESDIRAILGPAHSVSVSVVDSAAISGPIAAAIFLPLNVTVLNAYVPPADQAPLFALTVEYVLSHVADEAAIQVISVLFN